MPLDLAARLMHGLDRSARKLELATRLKRDRAAALVVGKPDDVPIVEDRFPAFQRLHAVEQRLDAAIAAIWHGPAIGNREREFLVLGADPELFLTLAARLEPRDELVARFDRRHINLVTGHKEVRQAAGRRPYTSSKRQGNDAPALTACSPYGLCEGSRASEAEASDREGRSQD